MAALRMGLLVVGALTAVALTPGASAWSDGDCWDSGDGSGCHWAEGNGWYDCFFFAGAYGHVLGEGFITGAAVCSDGAEARWNT